MKAIRRPDQYLRLRGDVWHYVRRVPEAVRHIDHRKSIYRSLDTDSRKVARQRRDICASADDQRWNEIAPGAFGSAPANAVLMDLNQRAQAYGFTYKPVSELLEAPDVEDLVRRIEALQAAQSASPQKIANDAAALLGTAETPSVTISQAIDLYLSEIILSELAGKSPEQIATFSKIKRRAVANFIRINGDLDMREITRDHAHGVRKPMSGSTGNKDLGSLRKLYRKYFEHIGDEERQNPFRNMRFAETKLQSVKSFDVDWVRNHVLEPNVFEGLNREGALLVMALIETGCRPSELANITPENICLNSDVPHIKIRATPNRQLKSGASKRDIPLVGVALEAMRNSPNGFPHYRDRGYLLSQSLTKAFKARKLFPSPQHRIYSFRHSFEKRMLEAGLDYGLRCTLMGHRNPRPEYGDGGSLVYRRDEMLKIVHPVGEALLASYPFTAKPSAVRSESVKRTVCLSGEDAIPLSRLATKLRANPRNERPPRSPLSRRA